MGMPMYENKLFTDDLNLILRPTPLKYSPKQIVLELEISKQAVEFWRNILPDNILPNVEVAIRCEQSQRMRYQNENYERVKEFNPESPIITGEADWDGILETFFELGSLDTIDISSYIHRGHYDRQKMLSQMTEPILEKFVWNSPDGVKMFDDDIERTKAGFPGLSKDIDPSLNGGIRRVRPEKRFVRLFETNTSRVAVVARLIDLKLVFESKTELMEEITKNGAFSYNYHGKEAIFRNLTVHVPIATNLFIVDLNKNAAINKYFPKK